MGAETRIMVEVELVRTEWREVYAVTRDEARKFANQMPGVLRVLDARYPEEMPSDPTPAAQEKP